MKSSRTQRPVIGLLSIVAMICSLFLVSHIALAQQTVTSATIGGRVADASGAMVPPGAYRVKMTMGSWTDTQPITLTLDPRLAANGVTAADLREQFEHNNRMRDLVAEVGQIANRVRQARTRLRAGGNADSLAKIEALAATLFGPDEGIRYGRPGLQTQITYLAGMTGRVDQRVGRDAIERYQVLKKELAVVEGRASALLGVQP